MTTSDPLVPLTRQDFELLFEALDAIKSKEVSSALVGSMVSIMMAKSKEEVAKVREQEERKFKQAVKHRKLLDERITLLKAKLIQLRDSIAAENMLKE